uniref:Alpha-1,3/1,6-mannosyltransferase ALG2 n=1 Tax=Corethrella appendiculata TaxID=1370023 RepID=U5EV04_9DIPT
MVRVLFVHPDLGIGGAERLVVDSALALQNKGHTVSFLTNHHDTSHCFEETRNGQLQVQTVGDWLPRNIFGKFTAFCAYIRMVYAAFYFTFYMAKNERFDVIFCDSISLGIPILKLAKSKPKILFYCHFPDLLLSKPGNFLKKFYRIPLNYLEEITTAQADSVVVNSKFTSRIFKDTFKRIDKNPDVLYPSLNTKYFDETQPSENDNFSIPIDSFVFLSLNRYERKKNVGLALRAFKTLETLVSKYEWNNLYLIIAGGYDSRVIENVEHFIELDEEAERLEISKKVKFLQSPSDRQKLWLLHRCQALIYTPENEHFGIVPLEGMYFSKPVIAVNSGGPTETVIHDQTGFLCPSNHEEFAKSMCKLVKDIRLCERMGDMGRKRVQQRFSFDAFTEKLENLISDLIPSQQDSNRKRK